MSEESWFTLSALDCYKTTGRHRGRIMRVAYFVNQLVSRHAVPEGEYACQGFVPSVDN